jgi:hypothetical protein
LFCAKRPCWRKGVQRGGCWGEEEERWITQHAADRLNNPERHRASKERVENLRLGGAHPRPDASSEDDGRHARKALRPST